MQVLIIGLDGATWDVLDDFVLDNYMPNLKRLKIKGSSGVLQSTDPPLSPIAWTTCITGCHPKKHKIFGFHKCSIRDHSVRISNAKDRLVQNMFQELSRQEYKVASINIPWTYPVDEINGIMVAGLGFPGVKSEFTYPSDFKNELLEKMPDYEAMARWDRLRDHDHGLFEDNISRAERSFQYRLETARMVCEKMSCDLMMVQFHDLDMIQHNVWDYLDSKSRDKYPKQRDRLFEMLQKLDIVIGDLISLANNENLTVLVVSDHGFLKRNTQIRANMLLSKWGFLKRRQFTDRLGDVFSRLKQRFGSKKVGYQRVPKNHVDSDFVWAKSKAAVIHGGMVGQLYVNLNGRSLSGCVKPGAEHKKVVEEIRKRFSDMKHPVKDASLFAKVISPTEYFNLEKQDTQDHGDLMLICWPGDSLKLSGSSRGKCFEILNEDSCSGLHSPRGIYAICGPRIKGGYRKTAQMVDIAPTVYALLGAKLPSYMDGRVMQDIFSGHVKVQYQSSQDGDSIESNKHNGFSEQEHMFVHERLAELGYMD